MKKPSRFTSLLVLLQALLLGSLPVKPAGAGENTKPEPIEKSKLWLGVGAGVFLGFGSGQYVEDRWHQSGWPFAVADGLAWTALLATFGDCMSCTSEYKHREDRIRTGGAILLLSSRIIQVGELLVYGAKEGMFSSSTPASDEKAFRLDFLPLADARGGQLVGSVGF